MSPSGENVVPSGPNYPETSLVNGQIFYNTTNGRTAIYFNSFWKELPYVMDFPLDGGFASTLSFDNFIDSGEANTSIFVGPYDGGQA